MRMVKVSVIMPVYEASDYLNMSINSVINQEIEDIELICVNDGSKDNSSKILKKYSKQHDFIKVINQENSGPAVARNNGLEHATGEYIAFLDADDKFLDKTALKKMHELATDTKADMVGANLKRIKKDGHLEENYDFENTLYTYFTNKETISPQEYGIPWAFYKNIYKKSFLEENNIKFPNYHVGEDPVFLANVLTKIKQIPVLNIDLYGYNHSVGGGLNIKLDSYDKKREYIEHYMEVFDILKNNSFEESYYSYKKEFIDYINFRQNINDEDIQKIVQQLSDVDNHFKDDDYGYFILECIRKPAENENEEYNLIKKCIFEESILEDSQIDIKRLKEFTKISESSDENRLKSSFKQLKQVENHTFEEKRELSGEVGKLKKDIKHYIEYNDKILTSNSWKITSSLRSLKHKI